MERILLYRLKNKFIDDINNNINNIKVQRLSKPLMNRKGVEYIQADGKAENLFSTIIKRDCDIV